MAFPCTKCGACCRVLPANIPNFPEPLKEDGSCSHLQDDNTCGIYDRRPVVCNIDAFHTQNLADTVSLEEFYKFNAECCNTSMDALGLPEDLRIPPWS